MVRVTTVAIRTALRFGVLVAGALLAASAADAQKTGGLAFWEPPKADEPILERSPHNDPGRYAALRQAFVEFHCTGDLMQEQPVGPRSDRNLICTLPGQTPDALRELCVRVPELIADHRGPAGKLLLSVAQEAQRCEWNIHGVPRPEKKGITRQVGSKIDRVPPVKYRTV